MQKPRARFAPTLPPSVHFRLKPGPCGTARNDVDQVPRRRKGQRETRVS